MARTTAWESRMRQAAEKLSRACADLADRMSGDETAIKEVKELAAAMTELAAMRAALQKQPPAGDPVPQTQTSPAIRVVFSPDAEKWRE